MLLYHNILRLNIPVDNILTLQIMDSLQQLLHNVADRHIALN